MGRNLKALLCALTRDVEVKLRLMAAFNSKARNDRNG